MTGQSQWYYIGFAVLKGLSEYVSPLYHTKS